MTLDEIKEFVNNTHKDYTVLDERTIKTANSSRREILVKHNICGNTYWLQLNRVTGKHFQECPYCNSKKSKITNDIFIQKVKELTGDEYDVIGNYVNNYTKIKLRHNKCNKIIEMLPKHFLNDGHRCKECAIKDRYNKNFKKDLANFSNNTIIMIDEYQGAHKKIKFKCLMCNQEFMAMPSYFYKQYRLYGECRCTKCTIQYVGEMFVNDILKSFNIRYTQQDTINGCKYKKLLKFDFIIYDNNFSPIGIIEFDGKQHFTKASFQTDDEFKQAKIRDEIKDKFCKKHNIPLLRISDYNKNTLKIKITNFLKLNKIIS